MLYVKAMISYTSKRMLLHTTFKLNLVIAVKIKHTLPCLYIELYEESVVFGIW